LQNIRLHERRIELNLTPKEVAMRAGISRSHYVNIEDGRRIGTLPVLKRIADALESSIDDVFFDRYVAKRDKSVAK